MPPLCSPLPYWSLVWEQRYWHPLHSMAASGQLPAVAMLLESGGVDVNCRTEVSSPGLKAASAVLPPLHWHTLGCNSWPPLCPVRRTGSTGE